MTSPTSYDAEHAAARRAVARRLHPDVGGDVHEYLAAMEQVDRQFGAGRPDQSLATHTPGPVVLHRSSPLSSAGKRTRAAMRTVQSALPNGWPGSRRYGRL